ncbi:MAG: cupredoxin domain-containing protein [Sphingomicrobium sp.]
MTRFPLLLLLALANTAPAAAQAPASVPITLSSFRIAPSTIHLAAGQPVRLLFTNGSGSSHDFTAPAFFGRAGLLSGPVARGEVDLPGHSSAIVILTPARGIYKAKCTHFGHKLMGMSATIVVD